MPREKKVEKKRGGETTYALYGEITLLGPLYMLGVSIHLSILGHVLSLSCVTYNIYALLSYPLRIPIGILATHDTP